MSVDAHEDNRPVTADYVYSYYATEMRAIPNHKKTNLTNNSNNKKRRFATTQNRK